MMLKEDRFLPLLHRLQLLLWIMHLVHQVFADSSGASAYLGDGFNTDF